MAGNELDESDENTLKWESHPWRLRRLLLVIYGKNVSNLFKNGPAVHQFRSTVTSRYLEPGMNVFSYMHRPAEF